MGGEAGDAPGTPASSGPLRRPHPILPLLPRTGRGRPQLAELVSGFPGPLSERLKAEVGVSIRTSRPASTPRSAGGEVRICAGYRFPPVLAATLWPRTSQKTSVRSRLSPTGETRFVSCVPHLSGSHAPHPHLALFRKLLYNTKPAPPDLFTPGAGSPERAPRLAKGKGTV